MLDYRLHILGLAHLPTNKTYEPCAYTQKIRRLCSMMKNRGLEVIFYGVEGSDVEADEIVMVLSKEIWQEVYGNYDWKANQFRHDPKDKAHQEFNKNAAVEIEKRILCGKNDILCITMGNYQKPITDALEQRTGKAILAIESGIGYEGIYLQHRIFESYAWMHYLYGKINQFAGNFFDNVIPNAYDPNEFIFNDKKEDYFLMICRPIPSKGIMLAVEMVKRLNKKLLIAGQGNLNDFCIDTPLVEHIGVVTGEQKKQLLSKATALIVPTYYIGPFEGVMVEANMSGTPAITTDWGCFSENIENGVNGQRCRMLNEFVEAGQNALNGYFDSETCYAYAVDKFSTDTVSLKYNLHFNRLNTLFSAGWYSL